MARQQSRGVCQLCSETFTKGGMSRHLTTCKEHDWNDSKKSLAQMRLLHLVVEDRYNNDYWLHLEVPEIATLGMLDQFLRDIWLECCGHLSEFFFDDTRYISYEEEDSISDIYLLMSPSESMFETKFMHILPAGATFRYSYDFGSTTELQGRVVTERDGRHPANTPVQLLARNLPPQYPCSECSEPAAWICPFCQWEGKGMYCLECGQDHDCEDGEWDMLMPVVNSPRTGVCAYTGGPLT